MTKGVMMAAILGGLGVTGMLTAFLTAASPTVTVADAKESRASVYLAGTMVDGTLSVKPKELICEFDLKDDKGDTIRVFHKGHQPANLGTTARIVAKGKSDGTRFVADKIMTKCPSKYEEEGEPKSKDVKVART
jgi:cytochrome c-type biogenesis protein CcmE